MRLPGFRIYMLFRKGGERLKRLWYSRRFWLVLRIVALVMIAYALLMLAHSYFQTKRGRADFIPEVEALRPVRESAAQIPEKEPAVTPPLSLEEKLASAVALPEEAAVQEPSEQGPETEPPEEPIPEEEAPPPAAADPAVGPAEEPTQEQAPAETAPSSFDLASLQAINPDIVGWLTVDGTEVDFPLLQDLSFRRDFIASGGIVPTTDGPRNALFYHYLYWDYLGNPSPMGSITVDYRNDPDLGDDWVVIYGHNAGQSGVMLSDLKRFCEADFTRENPSAVLWRQDGGEELRLLMVSVIDGYSREVFELMPYLQGESIDRAAALEVLEAGALFPGQRPAEDARCVLLVTCYEDGRPDDPRRLVLLYEVSGESP